MVLVTAAVMMLPSAAFATGTGTATAPAPTSRPFSVFDMPKMSEQLAGAFRAARTGRFDEAEQRLRAIIKEYPGRDENYYLLARLLAVRGQTDAALSMLETAINKGFLNAAILQKDPNLKSIRSDKRFSALVEKILKARAEGRGPATPRPAPYLVRDGKALVSAENTRWNPRAGLLLSKFKFPGKKPASSVVQGGNEPVAKLLTQWYRKGLAAGNYGDLYDNRDRGHSTLQPSGYPQLAFTRYSEAAKAAGTDYGLNDHILFNAITFGNSSTAVTHGKLWRSQARLATTTSFGAERLFLQYINNMLYIYPAVRDYGEKFGDILTANTPYMLVSRGKSGSDRPFLNAVASILAAFKPKVKDYLRSKKLVMPTVQMLFREGQSSIRTEKDYLTYKAHPPVFDSLDIDLGRMVRMAEELEIKDVPPVVQLSVEEASKMRPGIDDFARIRPEELFETPGAISRAVRASALNSRLVVSASKTKAPAGQKLTYHWVVLRGNDKRIKITPKNAEKSVVEITVPWQAPFPAPERPDLMTSRVEIAAFVSNGTYYSAPAFVNFLFPANQVRKYNKKGQIVMIDHMDPTANKRYVDPQIFASRNWRDDYHYDDAGNLTGWTRTRSGDRHEEFNRNGELILETDSLGRPLVTEKVRYQLSLSRSGEPIVSAQPGKQRLRYSYRDDRDRLGRGTPE